MKRAGSPMLRSLVVVSLALATLPITHARQSAARTIHVEGHVVDALTGRPVRGVVVLATMLPAAAADGPAAAFLTGEDGRFVFRDLPGSSAGLFASKTGYLHGEAGPISLPAGGRKTDVRLPMTPEGVISGRIVDQFGEPVGGARVRAVPPGARPSVGEPALTDDTGRYVIGGLERGLYLVTAEAASVGTTVSYESVFFPAARIAADATAIDIEPGVERAGADMTVTLRGKPSDYFSKELLSDASDAGVIAGVVRDVSGRTLAHTTVLLRLAEGGATTRQTNSDSDGRFQFEGVPPGRLNVVAVRPGYQTPPKPAPGQGSWKVIELRAGQREHGLALVLAKSASVSGRILDQFGDPMTGSVTLIRPDALVPLYQTRSNARGEFRILSVEDGAYVLSVEDNPFGRDLRTTVSPEREQTVAMLPVFYPGVTEASIAASLTVSAGSDLTGLDIVVRPQPVSVIDVEIDADGRATRDLTIDRIADRRFASQARAKRSPDGARWWIESTPAGRHEIVASAVEVTPAGPRGGPRLWASAEIGSDGMTPASLSLVLRPGARVSGTIVHEGAVSEGPIRVGLQGAGGPRLRVAGPTQEISPVAGGKRSFAVSSIEPGKYFLMVFDVKQVSTVKSIVIDGRDVQERPLELSAGADISNVIITLTDQITQISGTVRFDPVANPTVMVIAFPADPLLWGGGLIETRWRSSPVGPDNRYSLRGLAPGDYRVAALVPADIAATDGRNGLFKKLLPASSLVSLKLGETRTQDLSIK